MNAETIIRVLRATAFDSCDGIWWRLDDEGDKLQMYANCNDFFYWGCADGEEITTENVALLELARSQLEAIEEEMWTGLLFCSIARQMRPQGAYYKHLPEKTWPLFDVCGPLRETDMGNPTVHPSEVDA